MIGVSRPEQVVDCANAADNLSFTSNELKKLDTRVIDGDIKLWAAPSDV